jgi:hypothetical protein
MAAIRASLMALLICCGIPLAAIAQSQQQPAHEREIRSVRTFINLCRTERNVCIYYLVGLTDGVLLTEARSSTAYSHCTRGASYPELADAYLSFLNAEQLKGNVAILSELNGFVFLTQFMDARYHC